jgi:hypothetical protein
MDLLDTLKSSAYVAGGAAINSLAASGEASFGDVLGDLNPKPAGTPTAAVKPTPGTAASPEGSNPISKINVPFLGPVSITVAVIGAIALGGVLWYSLRK